MFICDHTLLLAVLLVNWSWKWFNDVSQDNSHHCRLAAQVGLRLQVIKILQWIRLHWQASWFNFIA